MTLALRWMGDLVTDDDRDRAARVALGRRRSVRLDERALPLSRSADPAARPPEAPSTVCSTEEMRRWRTRSTDAWTRSVA